MSVLHYVTHVAVPAGLRYPLCVPWLHDKLSPPIVMEEPVGRSHSVLVITSPVWPCIYRKMWQDVLIEHPFSFFFALFFFLTVEIINKTISFYENPLRAQKTFFTVTAPINGILSGVHSV